MGHAHRGSTASAGGVSFRWIAQALAAVALLALAGCEAANDARSAVRPPMLLPPMRWDHRPEASEWTRATIAALQADGAVLVSSVPRDIERFCPAYPEADLADRQAFWAGLLSALAKHESSWNPAANGGGGRWRGILQIAPETARQHGCALPAAGLYDGAANLTCAVRIVTAQVARDGAVASDGQGWRGLARDWMPLRQPDKTAEIAGWTRAQPYCRAG